MRRNDSKEFVELGLGFVGFFAVVFVIITASCELTGQPALIWAIVSLVLVIAFVLLLQARRRIEATRLRAEEARAAQDA
jgi:cytochrome c-type biogenesis protein CcmH/NrfF